MGRRKERRLAAMSAAGRRVKLDLFAEPSGDLGGSSSQDKVGENGDSGNHAGLPNSPSSSGQQPGNPLLLLEQYSDDELDEDSGDRQNRAVSEDPSADSNSQTKVDAVRETEDIRTNDEHEPSVQKLEQLLVDHESTSQKPSQELRKEGMTLSNFGDVDKGTNLAEEVSYPVVTDAQVTVDASSGWKVLLHEESNQYYYWNTTTGETSWEVPQDLAVVNDLNFLEKAAAETEEKSNGLVGVSRSSMALDMEHGNSTDGQLNGSSNLNCRTTYHSEQVANMDGYIEGFNSDSVYNGKGNRDAGQSNESSLLADNTLLGTSVDASTETDHGRHSEECEIGIDFSSELVKHCESLLEKLNSAESSNCQLQACDLISKYALEVEIRLADIKALVYHGSSLRPFWLHSKVRLKQLETAVHNLIVQYNSATLSEVEGTNKLSEGGGDVVDPSENKPLFPAGAALASEYAAHSSYFKSYVDSTPTAGRIPQIGCPSAHSGDGSGGKSDVGGVAIHSELTPKTVLHSVEVDMDVDMEVEETVASVASPVQDTSAAQPHISSEQSNVLKPPADQNISAPGHISNVPPPPDDDWIPPPPPDDEPFPPPPPDIEPPPPPPDEPPETSASTSNIELAQPFTYTTGYNLSYPGCSLEYYGQTNMELSGASMYTHQEGGQVAASHVPQYYNNASNVYGAAPLVVNPIEPSAYYGLQNGTVNSASLVGGTAMESSSGNHNDTILNGFSSETAGSFEEHAETGSSLLPSTKVNDIESDHVPLKVSGVPDSQHTIEAPATTSDTGASVPSTSSITATVVAGASSSKVQTKVSRNKKRAAAVVSTTRSNKKVSSLVDKWKAAKEELLQEEEEEPENAYEMLEKKRQREIEKWRAQQIAHGEAKDNANFQPLGGDWRERVKRKRAQKMNGTEQSESEVAVEGDQKPDLAALSRGLPSGWQIYWDESSKQVYYGNVDTSETTWNRPTE